MSDEIWLHPDRGDLYQATKSLVDERNDADLLGECVDTLLNDLEIYDDPRQGAGSWLFPDELPLIDDFAVRLKAVVAENVPAQSGNVILTHPNIEDVRKAGRILLNAITQNGRGVPSR